MRRTGWMCRRRAQPGRRGTATVELAMVLPVLLLLIFGAIEVGLLIRATLAVNHVANEAARVAAIGGTPAQINASLVTSYPGLAGDQIVATYTSRTWDVNTQAWGEWRPLGSIGTENDAPPRSQIRVELSYPYRLVLGGFFGTVLHAADDNTVTLSTSMITIRE